MATYNELFPNGDPNLREPFDPIRPRKLGGSIGGSVRRALPTGGGNGLDAGLDMDKFMSDLDEIMGAGSEPPAPSGKTRWTDPLKNLAAGTVDVGTMGLGALEYGSRQLLGNEEDVPLTSVLAAGRRGLAGVSEDITQSMSPEAQDLLMRQMDTLDPQRTVWQNPVDALRSIGYKFARSLPSTVATLLPAARLFKGGMSPAAITYLGASEGGLSLGGIANNIAQEIEGMSDQELQAESPRFGQLLKETGNPVAARQGLIQEAQGVAPLVGGVIVGAISSVAGRYLEPVFDGAGAGITGRFLRGAAAETPQEASQSAVEQYVQNIAAKVYDLDRSAGEGVLGATLEGGVIGGLTGGAFTAVAGKRRQALPTPPPPGEPPPPVPPDIEAALRNSPLMEDEAPEPTMAYGQGEMFGPPPGQPDIAPMEGNLRDRFGFDPTRDAALTQPTNIPHAAPAGEPMAFGGTDPAGFALQQGQFQFTYPPEPTTAVAPPPEGIQYPLGLREPDRVRGRGRAIITPREGRLPLPPIDMSAPPEFSNERVLPDRAARVPLTRGDFVEQERARRYEGTLRDENQLDMFDPSAGAEPPPPPPPPGGSTAARSPEAFIVRGTDDKGQTVYEEIFPTREEAEADLDANTLNEQGELKQQPFGFSIEPVYGRRPAPAMAPAPAADEASREPPSDIMAQMQDLANPQHPRKGVYLSRDNVQNLRQLGVLDQVRSMGGVPLMNFDLRGGTLIAKDRKIADAALTMRKQGVPMQEILGIATGAGRGKPADNRGRWVAQQLDAADRVTRETLTETEEEAQALADQWEQEPGRSATVMRVDVAIKRRERLAEQEGQELEAQKKREEVRRTVSAATLGIPDTLAAEAARAAVPPTTSLVAAARALASTAQDAETDRILQRSGKFDSPKAVRFTSRAKDRAKIVAPPVGANERTKARFQRMLDFWKGEREKLREHKKRVKGKERGSPERAEYAVKRQQFKLRHDKWVRKHLRTQTPQEMRAAREARDAEINERYRNAFERRQELRKDIRTAEDRADRAEKRLRVIPERSAIKSPEDLKALKKELEKAQKERDALYEDLRKTEEELSSYYHVYRVQSTATDIAEAAKKVSPAGARREMDAPAAGRKPANTPANSPIPEMQPLTDAQIDALKPGQLDAEFVKAAAFMSGIRPSRKRDQKTMTLEETPRVDRTDDWLAASYESTASRAAVEQTLPVTVITAGRTIQSYVDQYTRDSEKRKFIRRAQQLLRVKGQPGGKVKARIGAKSLDLSPLYREDRSATEREVSAAQREQNAAKIEKSFANLRAAMAKTNAVVTAAQSGPYAALVQDHIAMMDAPLVRGRGMTEENWLKRKAARQRALHTSGQALYGRTHLRNLRRIALSLLRARNRTLKAAQLADKITEALNSVAGIKASTPEGAVELAKALSKLSGISAERFEAGKGVNTFKLAFDEFLAGRPTALRAYLRALNTEQLYALLDKRVSGGPHPEPIQQALDNIQRVHEQWLTVAKENYDKHVRPVMEAIDKGTRKVSDEQIAHVRRGLDRIRANNLPIETVRALRRLNPADPRLPENYAPTMDLLVAPLTARLQDLGFTFDENGRVSGWQQIGLEETEGQVAAGTELDAYSSLLRRMPGYVAGAIAEGRRTAEQEAPTPAPAPVQESLLEPAKPAPKSPQTQRMEMTEAYDQAVMELRRAIENVVAPTQLADAEDKFYVTLRNLGVWKDDGISDLLPATARSYNNRVGPRLRRGQMTLTQAADLLQERFQMQGRVEVRGKVVSEVVPVNSFSPHESPMRPDITPDKFRALPREEQDRIRNARLEELRRRKNLSVEARRELERLDKSVMPDPTRPDLDAAAFRKLPPAEREAIRKARLAANSRRVGDAKDTIEYRNPSYGRATTYEMATADRIVRYLDVETRPTIGGILQIMHDMLPKNHWYRPLVELMRYVPGIQKIRIELTPSTYDGGFFSYEFDGQPSSVFLGMGYLEKGYLEEKQLSPRALMHTLLHEFVHAATVAELVQGDAKVIESWQRLRELTYSYLKKNQVHYMLTHGVSPHAIAYGNTNLREFVAEVFTNPELQRAMKRAYVKDMKGRLWDRLVRAVRELFSFRIREGTERTYDTLFDFAIDLAPRTFSGRPATQRTRMLGVEHDMARGDARPSMLPAVADMFDSMDSARTLRERVRAALQTSGEVTNSGVLSVMTADQINDFFGQYFEQGENSWLNAWHDAFVKRNADNSKNMEEVDKISRDWTKLREDHQNDDQPQEFSRIATEATIEGVWPNYEITHPKNRHVKHPAQRRKHAELRERFLKLAPEWRPHWDRLVNYYASSIETEQNLAVLNALRAYLTTGRDASMSPEAFVAKYKEDSVAKLKLNTAKGLRAAFTEEQLPNAALKNVVRLGTIAEMWEGPYFPLSRFGKYIVYAEKVKETRSFANKAAARKFVEDLKMEDPTIDYKYDPDSDGKTVHVLEIEYRQKETRYEANRDEQEMVEKYGRDAVSPVQLKEDLFTKKATIEGPQGLKAILDSLGDNAAAKSAIKNFYLRSLGENSFRKHEKHRMNRRGVDAEIQHRAFAAYSKAAAYYISQLRYGWRLARARAEISKFAKEHRDESEISAIRMQQIAREIRLRDEMTVDPNEVSNFIRKSSEITQFSLLATASYWLINSTQPWMVTLPWLGAQFGATKAAQALAKAQGMIANPIWTQAVESRAGLKALFSKVAAEKAFTVLEQVEEHLEQNLGKDKAAPYKDMLKELKRRSIIDLSFIAELREIAEGMESGRWQKVLDASRIMAHLTEVNNRIMTAVAAYDLAMSKEGMTHEAAVAFAGKAVSQTQFNYSGANAPRLFQQDGPLGKAGPLLFQFMKYPQHLYALLVGNMLKAVKGSSPEIRREAWRILGGLSATHLAVGGLAGWTLQPLKWLAGVAIMGLNDDDDRWQDVVSGELYDRTMRSWLNDALGNGLGRAVGAGLPASLLNVDLSSRMSMGTLYFIDFRPENQESFIGSFVTSFGGPALSLAMTAAKAPGHILNGEYQKAVESFAPKFMKDISKAQRYATEGMTNSLGNVIVPASEFTLADIALQAAGFAPARVTETFAGQQAVRVQKDVEQAARTRWLRKIANADTPEERQQAIADSMEWSRTAKKPLTRSDIVKAIRRKAMGEARTEIYGLDLRGRDVLYADEFEPYEVE